MAALTTLQILLRLLTAMLIGLIVGSQRARRAHPAGVRTHMLVALGACAVMLTGYQLAFESQQVLGATPDPARLGAQVVSGIGFLGAGTIIKDGFSVRGLTTAASLWAVACLGLAAGTGYYELCLLGALGTLFTLVLTGELREMIYHANRPELNLRVECTHMSEVLLMVESLSERYFAVLADLSFGRTPHNTYIIGFRVTFPTKDHAFAQNGFRQTLAKVPGLISLENRNDI